MSRKRTVMSRMVLSPKEVHQRVVGPRWKKMRAWMVALRTVLPKEGGRGP